MFSVSPVSNVHFGENIDFGQPGRYTKTQVPEVSQPVQTTVNNGEAPKKSHKKLNRFLKTVFGLAVVAAAVVALPKMFPAAIKALPKTSLENANLWQKAGHYTAVVADFIANYTYKPILDLFKK